MSTPWSLAMYERSVKGRANYRPKQDKVVVWEASYEETLTNKDHQPIYVTVGDWIVEHPSGWIEKLTRQQLDDRYELA